ncbi:MAG: ABC transporter permease [Chloroflexia bacterium]|jgi:ABC-2 type transport system permease protein|nr:ABC transporter permease [Chloroflexia bacterium]
MSLTITILTIRQFLRSRSIYVVLGISLLASVLAVIVQVTPGEMSIRDLRDIFANVLYQDLIAATLLPLATLVLSTAAVGDEIEDRTLQYLTLKPIGRFRIVFEKLLAVIVVMVPIVWLGIAVTWAIVAFGNVDALRNLLWPALASSLVAIVGFGSLFLLLSMVMQRALLVGVFYVFVWETALSRFLPGIRSISIRHYTQSLFVRLVDDRRVDVPQLSAQSTVIVTTVAICVVCVILATWRLRSMSLE